MGLIDTPSGTRSLCIFVTTMSEPAIVQPGPVRDRTRTLISRADSLVCPDGMEGARALMNDPANDPDLAARKSKALQTLVSGNALNATSVEIVAA